MRFPLRFPSYRIPDLSDIQNSAYQRNLEELELPNTYIRYITTALTTVSSGAITPRRITWTALSTIFPKQGISTSSTGTAPIVPFDAIWTIDVQLYWDLLPAVPPLTGLRRMFDLVRIDPIAGTTLNIARRWEASVQDMFHGASVTGPLRKGQRIAVDAMQDGTTVHSVGAGDGNTFLAMYASGVAKGST